MFDSMTEFTLISSLIVGLSFGVGFSLYFKRPKTIYAFAITLLLNVLSPWIGVNTALLDVSCSSEAQLMASPFLFSFFTVINIIYIIRFFKLKLKPA
ncbi:MAG: hypothetical protein U9N54_03165 [candidate division Zixibacteria bacterium]|nr:hypothetical protein [candidate division Zixibacteria bacterium]